jgi:hypothetical protein
MERQGCPKCGHPAYAHCTCCNFSDDQDPVRAPDGFLRIRPAIPCTCDLSGREVLLNIGERLGPSHGKLDGKLVTNPIRLSEALAVVRRASNACAPKSIVVAVLDAIGADYIDDAKHDRT